MFIICRDRNIDKHTTQFVTMHVRIVRLLTLLVCQYDSFNAMQTRNFRAVSKYSSASSFVHPLFHVSIRCAIRKLVHRIEEYQMLVNQTKIAHEMTFSFLFV